MLGRPSVGADAQFERCAVDGVLWPGDGKDNGTGDGTGHKPDYGGATAVLTAAGA